MSKLYFAYGSNLNKSQMALRSPTAKALGSAYFPNWRLVFRGVADIEEGDEQDLLPVGIWSIEESDEAALDRYEGVSSGLYRKVEINGMLTYRMNQSGIHSPSSYYFDTILNGYRDFSLDTSELYNARDNAHFEDRGGWGYASWM
tara:strand:- start:74 stop:508 length:435 start_codon:yes stop_codon:yes gene_type:complete